MIRRSLLRRAVMLGAAFATVTGPVVGLGVTVGVQPASAAACVPAGATGFTAALVATPSQTIQNQAIDATGCDLGIYVPPAANGVTINGDTVSGANDHGILAEQVSGLTVENSVIQNNGVNPNQNIAVDKAIQLVAVTNSVVQNNTVMGNAADGGISVADEGPGFDPGAPSGGSAAPMPSTNDTIQNNNVHDNFGGCAIVIEAYVAGAGVDHITASSNTITGHVGYFGPHGPVIGQIVVAADGPGTTVSNTTVTANTIDQSLLSGITVHSNAPGDTISGTQITNNFLDSNNWGFVNGAPTTDAIALEVNDIPPPAPTPVLMGTTITGNFITNQNVGIWQDWHVTGTVQNSNSFDGPDPLFYQQPVPGKGYWMTAGDGGIFTFGNAGFHGSLGGSVLPAAITGMAQTRDQGGYVLAGADGSVYPFGDATDFGSAAGTPLNAPVVGVAETPVPVGPFGTPGTNGLGYWLVAADGGVFSYGDAKFFGSTGAIRLNQPIVGMAPTPDGLGYWLVAKDGGVFTFGDAKFFGSTGAIHLNQPVVGMARTPDGGGYWLVAADGGIFTFGDAKYYGSTGAIHLNSPVVGMAAAPDGKGYWLFARDGGVFTFGDAQFFGSMGAVHLNSPVMGGTATGSNGVAP